MCKNHKYNITRLREIYKKITEKKHIVCGENFYHLKKQSIFNTRIFYIFLIISILYIYNNLRLLVAKSDVETKLGVRMKYGPPILHILGTTKSSL